MSRESGRFTTFLIAVVSVLTGALITGAGTWLAWGSAVVTEPKVIELIETRSPYLEDRKVLLKQCDEIDELTKEVQELKVLIYVLVEREHGPLRENGYF